MTRKCDLVVIGGGPGGYVAAIKASQLGMKVACIEKRGALGGTCLNEGCIPSKALLHSSYKFYDAQKHFGSAGIECSKLSVDVQKMMSSKDKIVSDLGKGIEGLFKKNKVDYIKGEGRIVSKNLVSVVDSGEEINADNILIATGSEVAQLPNIKIDEEFIVSSKGALSLDKIPNRMLVIGGGVIGLELGSVWSRLGSKVTVIEFNDLVLQGMDSEIRKNMKSILEKQGMQFILGSKVVSAEVAGKEVQISYQNIATTEMTQDVFDVVLVAIGRRPYTDKLGLEELNIELDQHKRIPVNDKFQTNIPNIYAIGDVIAGPMLAHKAEEDGVAAVSIMSGQYGHVDYNLVPNVVYTHPEVASVGKTEEQLQDINYRIGKFPLLANSRARANSDTEGFVKVITDHSTDRILGVHIIADNAGDLIQQVVLAMEYSGSAEDIARTCHAHPTLSEAVKEACMAAYDKPIHI